MKDDILTVSDATEQYDVPGRTIRKAIEAGHLKATRKSIGWIFTRADFERWKANPEAHRVGRPADRKAE